MTPNLITLRIAGKFPMTTGEKDNKNARGASSSVVKSSPGQNESSLWTTSGEQCTEWCLVGTIFKGEEMECGLIIRSFWHIKTFEQEGILVCVLLSCVPYENTLANCCIILFLSMEWKKYPENSVIVKNELESAFYRNWFLNETYSCVIPLPPANE